MKIYIKLIIKSNLVLVFFLALFSCNKETVLYLKEDKNDFLRIVKESNSIKIYEKNLNRPTKVLSFINGEYYIGNVHKINNDTYVFLSTKKKYELEFIDNFSLLNDSIKIKKLGANNYITEIKSNKKPINYKYFYDKDFNIYKLIYKKGNHQYIYQK